MAFDTQELQQFRDIVDEQLEKKLGEKLGKSETTIVERLDGLESRFNHLEGRFDRLEKQFIGMEERFDGLEKRFDILDSRFDTLEEKVDRFFWMESEDIQAAYGQLEDHENRLQRLELKNQES